MSTNSFDAASSLQVGGRSYYIFSLDALRKAGVADIHRLPYCIKVVLENLLRNEDGRTVKHSDIEYVAKWDVHAPAQEINLRPARVLLQDFTGVPCVVRPRGHARRARRHGLGPEPRQPADPGRPRHRPLRPGRQVRLARRRRDQRVDRVPAKPRTLRLPALGPVGLPELQRRASRHRYRAPGEPRVPGQGGLHQRRSRLPRHAGRHRFAHHHDQRPRRRGLGRRRHRGRGLHVGPAHLHAASARGRLQASRPLKEGATATDLVLTITEILRKKGVVGKFVEYYGPGVSELSLADRATISNMSPEYGATIGIFPIDTKTLDYLRMTNRSPEQIALIEAYAKAQGMFLTQDSPDPVYTDTLELDLATVVPSLAGPKRPQDRIDLPDVKRNFLGTLGAEPRKVEIGANGARATIQDGSVVIAAITSCTNTSNPSVLVAAGLVAKKAVERGLDVKPWVKTSLAPGSKVVLDYLSDAGLMPYLEQLKFHVVGYGCTTCIGNSGPLPEPVAEAVQKEKLVVASVLSGNRNFEGRINALVRANYLASPPLVVAYALAGRVDIDLEHEPLGVNAKGEQIYLRDVWPTNQEVQAVVSRSVRSEMFEKRYSQVFDGGKQWNAIQIPAGEQYVWDDKSTYIKKAPFFDELVDPETFVQDLSGLRVLAMLGDSVTTDHISPAGSIGADSPAGRYLIGLGVKPADFNSYGSRRGNHEVMIRGTLANVRLRNQIAPGTEGGWTTHMPSARTHVHLRRVRPLSAGRRIADHRGRQGVWLGFVARLGGQGRGSARRPRRDRRKLRAHPPLEPGRDGCSSP